MEVIFEVLIILGIISFGIIGQIRKAARTSENTDERQYPVYTTDDVEEDYSPQMDFDGSPPPPPVTVQQFKSRQKKTTPIMTPGEVNKSPLKETENINQEFDIHSLDDVRKGIIWSEILNRKY